MNYDNVWLNKSEQEVTVHLKRHIFRYRPDGFYEQYLDMKKDEPQSMTVKVKRFGLSRGEKLAVVVEAALKHFNNDVNYFLHDYYESYVGMPTATEAPIVIEDKFLKNMPHFIRCLPVRQGNGVVWDTSVAP